MHFATSSDMAKFVSTELGLNVKVLWTNPPGDHGGRFQKAPMPGIGESLPFGFVLLTPSDKHQNCQGEAQIMLTILVLVGRYQ